MMALLLIAAHAFAVVRCEDALMSTVYEGKEKVESTRLCVEDQQREGAQARVQGIASTNCHDTENEKACLAYAKALEAAFFRFENLKPFELCLKLGGEPESIRFQMTSLGIGVWHRTDRCRFDLDYSYLDTKSFAGVGVFKPRSISSSSTGDQNQKR